jgi:hypothetical protein
MRGIVSNTFSRTPSLIVRVAILLSVMLTAGTAQADDGYRAAGGLAVYFGVVPASVVRGHPPGHTEGTMHGGAEQGSHQKHLVVAVFDAATGARIENAQVVASIEGLGHVGRQRVELEPMAIAGTITYGGFVNFPGNDQYRIQVDITVPGRSGPVTVEFAIEHSR